MRLVAGITLVSRGIAGLQGEPQFERAILLILASGAGILLLAGLWTPIAGVLAAVIEIWHIFSQPGDASVHIMLATLAIALALIGPGAWSVDARLFGWKRIDIRKP
jgi:putative oxidoreductase